MLAMSCGLIRRFIDEVSTYSWCIASNATPRAWALAAIRELIRSPSTAPGRIALTRI